MSAITGNITKKRKKSDAKPQSQINKCLNEKRRRTQENLYIDELAELVSVSDMSSGKTDKCQILQRTVDQIRQINDQTSSNSHDVQQGEVSSSNPSILSNDQVGPILLEALDGFLFVVNTDGRVEYVTDNVKDYINFTKDEVLGKDIYNIIHIGDAGEFMPNVLPQSVAGWLSAEPQQRNRTFECRFLVKAADENDETMEEKQQRVSQYETMQICSALLDNNSTSNNAGGPNNSSGGGNGSSQSDNAAESGNEPCVMCVARRISLDEKRVGQFTFKIDTHGKILVVDTSWLHEHYKKNINDKDLVNRKLQDLCHSDDLNKINTHLKDVLQVGESMSPIYRLSFCVATPPSERKYFNVQTKSKLFKGSVTSAGGYESDFIMATNSLFRTERDDGQIEKCPHSLSSGPQTLNSRPSNNNNNVGGPLMSVAGQLNGMSGTTSTAPPASTGRFPGSSSSSSSYAATFNHYSAAEMDAYDLFPSSTLDLDLDPWTAIENSRPDSRASNQQQQQQQQQSQQQPQQQQQQPQQQQQQQQHQSNSRPASQPNAAASSPLRAFSPATHAFGNTFPFSPLQDTAPAQPSPAMDQQQQQQQQQRNGPSQQQDAVQDNCQQQQQQQQQPSVSTESGRLRNLLTKGSSASDDSCQDNASASEGEPSNKPGQNRILKILLNQNDDTDDQYHASAAEHVGASKANTRASPAQPPVMVKSEPGKPGVAPGNHMLLQLLNEKTDDDPASEEDRGMKKPNELLTRLLKDTEEDKKPLDQNQDADLLRSLGFRNSSPSSSQLDHASGVSGMSAGQKRPVEDTEMNVAVKRSMDGSQVTSTGSSANNVASGGNGSCGPNIPSKLWEKNKMLASLLAKKPTQPTTIPPIPASVISGTPQDKLPRVLSKQQQQQQQQQPWASMQSHGGNSTATSATSAKTPLQNQRSLAHRQPTNMPYLNQLQQRNQMEQQHQQQMETSNSYPINPQDFRQLGNDLSAFGPLGDGDDPDLSKLLESVIDFVPESMADTTAILLDAVGAQSNEKLAINAIQESLMQIETAVNPTSSNMTTPGTPPAYSTAMANTSMTSSHNYQRPPMYQQQQQQQQRARLNAVQQAGIRQATTQFTSQQQQMQLQQRQKMLQAQQRLLQQQQQQQLLIPSNATAPDQITNIDTLMNSTVAPNVTLQRSGGPESQVSPSYGGSVQMPQGPHRLTHSYSHPSTLPQHPAVNNSFNSGQQATARLSPHSPAGILPFSHPQPLSPRVTQQGNYAGSPRMFNVNQVRQQQQPQQQQQQPGQQPGLQQQPQRSMSSPGTPVSARQSPFPAEAFPPPASPTASQFPPILNTTVNNPSAQYRMQRQASTPSATTQLPGGVGSPCHYGGVSKDQPLLSPSHPLTGCPATPTHNQHNANNTQHFSNHQHSSMLYHNAAGVQSSQYCYDRTSVNMYQSGPGDAQDCRPPPPSNPASHQMGGNTTGNAGGINSEYVRKELRTVVDARMQQQQQQQQRVPNNLQNNLSGQVSQEDLETLGLNYDLTAAGDALVSDGSAKSWAIGSAGTTPSSSRTTMEEVSRGDPKSSLLQKLLSE